MAAAWLARPSRPPGPTRRPGHWGTGVLVLATLALVACSPSSRGDGPADDDRNYVAGDGSVAEVAPERRSAPVQLSGPLLGGGALDLQSLRGQVVVLNVWGSWCPPCRKEAPILAKVSADLAGSGVTFIGIDTRDSDAAAQAFEENFGITYPSFVDPNGVLLLAFKGELNPSAIPTTLVLDRQGRVAGRILGGVTEGTLRGVVQQVLDEKP